MIPAGFESLFRISPIVELIGPVYSRTDVQRQGGRLAFATCYIYVGEQRIVRASGCSWRRTGHNDSELRKEWRRSRCRSKSWPEMLPRNAAGKILKPELKKALLS